MGYAGCAVKELEAFVTLARNDPSILHRPELTFFKEYLLSLGAKLPDSPVEESEEQEVRQGVSSQNSQDPID